MQLLIGTPPSSPWVVCEWGYEDCSVDGRAESMRKHDGGWICGACYATAAAEHEDWLRQARRS